MLKYISHYIITKLLPNSTDKPLLQICEYGCETLLYTILSTMGLLFIGLLTGFFIESIILIFIFYVLQSNGGGFHATSHGLCFISMVIGLFIGEILLSIPFSSSQYLLIAMVSTGILIFIPIHLHKNKEYLSNELNYFIIKSRIITICIFLATCITLRLDFYNAFEACCISLFLSVLSRLFAKLHGALKNSY